MVEMWVVGWWALFDMEEVGEGESGTKPNLNIFVKSSMGFK